MKRLTSDNKMLGYELMKAYPNISCFSTTRHGGCSKGNYASFNCNGYCGDNPEDVARNREMLCGLLPVPPIELVIPHQTHSAKVRIVDATYINRCAKDQKTSPIVTESPKDQKTIRRNRRPSNPAPRLLPMHLNRRLRPHLIV